MSHTRVKRISFSTTLRQASLNDLLKSIEPRHQLARLLELVWTTMTHVLI